ncbi:hypothetical protein ACFQ7B_24675 [Streptomyces erythrochromogenes]|uniref:hypothetical protein n=1 Tax=Streptomyces erythrochromogenes TaxID=285574 RepID=UPI0036ADE6C1
MNESFGISYRIDGDLGSDSTSNAADRLAILEEEEWVVRERWFDGSVDFRVGGSAWEYKGTPLLDFALALRYTVNILAANGEAQFDAQGGATLRLALVGANVKIEDVQKRESGECSFVDLVGSAARFLRELVDEITRARPDFLLNEVVRQAFRESGARELGEDSFSRYSRAGQLRGKLLKQRNAQGEPEKPEK